MYPTDDGHGKPAQTHKARRASHAEDALEETGKVGLMYWANRQWRTGDDGTEGDNEDRGSEDEGQEEEVEDQHEEEEEEDDQAEEPVAVHSRRRRARHEPVQPREGREAAGRGGRKEKRRR